MATTRRLSRPTQAPLLAAFLLYASAPQIVAAADAMPFFTQAYFASTCPEGWTSVDGAKGRFVVPAPLGAGVGGFAGDALDGKKPPAHRHQRINGKINLPSKNFVLIGGCCNGSLGDSGDYAVSGASEEASGDLPYAQYGLCIKTSNGDGSAIPSGLMTFMAQTMCPTSWEVENSVAGRYIVALPDNGTPYYQFGGKPLDPSEVRSHVHGVQGKIPFSGHDIAGASGCCASGYASKGDFNIVDTKTAPVAGQPSDSAVQAPYYTALMCRKH
ncbi:MAG: hypothetical protein ACN6PQ_14460 [Stenotrophomonas indicatrix]|uniref:hypothetical protein n=1 Tax=Stenotrophomonas indicatrix TaxID=2045451 RepID=UPI003D099B06